MFELMKVGTEASWGKLFRQRCAEKRAERQKQSKNAATKFEAACPIAKFKIKSSLSLHRPQRSSAAHVQS